MVRLATLGRGLFLVTVLPAALWATPYDGVYKQAANAECALVGVDGGAIEVRDGIFYGVEAECRMTRPVDVLEMDATLYTMQCSGEDQVWTERAMLMKPAADPETGEKSGLIMIWDGFAFVYEGCSEAADEEIAE